MKGIRRCLIADDVRVARELLANWMVEFGFECAMVTDGREAFNAVESSLPDLIISDIEMPRSNGLSHVNSTSVFANLPQLSPTLRRMARAVIRDRL